MIKRRNLKKQVLFTILSMGIYPFYWLYATSKEMMKSKGLIGRPRVWTLLQVIPIINLWRHSKAVEAVTDKKYRAVSIFVLWITFPPAVWWFTQRELNKLAENEAESRSEATEAKEEFSVTREPVLQTS